MEKLSWRDYLENETKLLWPIKNRIYSIIWKGPELSDLFTEISLRRAEVQNLLHK